MNVLNEIYRYIQITLLLHIEKDVHINRLVIEYGSRYTRAGLISEQGTDGPMVSKHK